MAERSVAHRIQATVASFQTWRISQDRYCTGLSHTKFLTSGTKKNKIKKTIVACMAKNQLGFVEFWDKTGFYGGYMLEVIDFKGLTIEISRWDGRKRLKLNVYPNGRIRVLTDRIQSYGRILDFLEEHWKWLKDSLKKSENLKKKYPSRRFVSREIYPFLGKDYELKLEQGFPSGLVLKGKKLHWFLPHREKDLDQELRQQYFLCFKEDYSRMAQKIMNNCVKLHSERMGLYPRGVRFGNQKTMWGSCSRKNRISLNLKLIVAPLEVIDYVVIHELSHIKYKNHSRDFWDLVDFHTPHRDFSKKWLLENRYKADFLSKKSELRE